MEQICNQTQIQRHIQTDSLSAAELHGIREGSSEQIKRASSDQIPLNVKSSQQPHVCWDHCVESYYFG